MKILFYVEPVVFGGNPLHLSPILNCFRCLINANSRNDVEYALATSQVLLDEYERILTYGGSFIKAYPVDAIKILEQYFFDKNLYAKDLFLLGQRQENSLDKQLRRIDADFQPDIVICPGQNAIVQAVFGPDRTLFFERGPVPRWNGRDNFYFDAGGHQVGSILATQTDHILGQQISDEMAAQVADEFASNHAANTNSDAICEVFTSYFNKRAAGKKIAIIANQPSDSILVAGGFNCRSPEEYMMSVLSRLPVGWVATATYHAEMTDYSVFDAYLESVFPNFIALPSELRTCGSDPFAKLIDGMITIASKAAFPAAVFGKKIIVSGLSMMSGLSGRHVAEIENCRGLSKVEAGRLLAFLSNRYTFSFEDCYERNHIILNFFDDYINSKDKIEYQLDMRDWTVAKFQKLI